MRDDTPQCVKRERERQRETRQIVLANAILVVMLESSTSTTQRQLKLFENRYTIKKKEETPVICSLKQE